MHISATFAKEGISGRVIDSNSKPVCYATVVAMLDG